MHILGVGEFVQNAHAPSAVGIWWRKRLAEALCLILGIDWHLFGGGTEGVWKKISHLNMIWMLWKAWVEKGHNVGWRVRKDEVCMCKSSERKNMNIKTDTTVSQTQEKLWHYFFCSYTASVASSTLVTWCGTMLLCREKDVVWHP